MDVYSPQTSVNQTSANPTSQSTREALALFDRLEPVDVAFMLGRWQGNSWPTDHPMDGLLEWVNWHGKAFIDQDQVHPLVFLDAHQAPMYINPNCFPMPWALKIPIPRTQLIGQLMQWLLPLFQTRNATAKLRMVDYRGKVSATMVYNQQPIQDIFRKLDENTVLGLVDMKGMKQPFFFRLVRES